MPDPTGASPDTDTPKLPFVVGIAPGHRHTGITTRIGEVLGPRGAAVITREPRETTKQYVQRILTTVTRFTQPLTTSGSGEEVTVVITGLPMGAAGPRLSGDLARLREVHETLHAALPDAAAVKPTMGERGGIRDYPRALTRRPAPTWLRTANQHPKGSREPLRAAWDATRAHLAEQQRQADRRASGRDGRPGSLPSPTPPASLRTLTDGIGSAPGGPAGRPGGEGPAAGAEPSPGGTSLPPPPARPPVPTPAPRPVDDTGPLVPTDGDPAEQTAAPTPDRDPLLAVLDDRSTVYARRGREYATARAVLAASLHLHATAAIDAHTARAARQQLPKRLSVTDRYDPRVLPAPRIDACAVEDDAYQRPWLLRHVRIGVGEQQLLERFAGAWRIITPAEIAKLPTLHAGRPRVVILRGRYEPTRLTLGLAATLPAAVAAGLAAAVRWTAEILAGLDLAATGVTSGITSVTSAFAYLTRLPAATLTSREDDMVTFPLALLFGIAALVSLTKGKGTPLFGVLCLITGVLIANNVFGRFVVDLVNGAAASITGS